MALTKLSAPSSNAKLWLEGSISDKQATEDDFRTFQSRLPGLENSIVKDYLKTLALIVYHQLQYETTNLAWFAKTR